MPVLLARNRASGTTNFILEAVDKTHASAELKPLLAKDAIFCIDSTKALAAVAEDIGVTHHPVNLSAEVRVDKPWHVQNVHVHHGRFKNWMRRFKGMASR